MCAAVVRPALARRGDRDLYGGGRHRQLAVRRRYAVVAGCAGRELVARQLVRCRTLARERDAACYNRCNRVIPYQALYVILSPALRCSVVGEFLILGRDRHVLRIDCQCAGHRRDLVALGHVFFAVHDLVACGDRVVAVSRVSHVRHAAGRRRYQLIPGQQFAARYGHSIVAVRAAVIRPALARRRDRDCHRGVHHRQLAIRRRYDVVVG